MSRPAKSLSSVALGLLLGGGFFFGGLGDQSVVGTPAAAAAVPHRQAPRAKATTSRGQRPGMKKAAHRTSGRHKQFRRAKRRVFLEARVPALKGQQPNVQALGAVVIDLESGHELWSRKPDIARPIASISKLAATLVVMERPLELEGLTTITRVDLQVARGGAQSRLFEGMTLTNRDLLHAALLGSDNRAVAALGRAVGLSAMDLATEMTKKAQKLGLKQTRFLEPTGLSPENVSTPREAVVLLREVMKHPILGPIASKLEYDAHPVSRPPIRYFSTHRPAVRSNVAVLGGKTGYNDHARYCLVVATRVDGRQLGMAFLGTEGKMTRFGDVARVADWVTLLKPKGPGAPGAPATETAIAKASAPLPATPALAPALFAPPAVTAGSAPAPTTQPASSIATRTAASAL